MRFGFRPVPEPSGATVRPRPILDVVVEGLALAPQACLIDTGATAIRMGMHVAELAGVDLGAAPEARIAVGGTAVAGRCARVTLAIQDAQDRYAWEAPVWFCDPWPAAFGLLGMSGFLDRFVLTMAAYEEWLSLEPVSA